MTTSRNATSDAADRPSNGRNRPRRVLLYLIPAAVVGLVLAVTAAQWFHYVPAGKMLILTAKGGKDLPPGHVLAAPGEKGVQREVLGEGWHFVTPFAYDAELRDDVVIDPGKVGVVTALGGDAPPPGQILVDDDNQQGVRRRVLPPGVYRINPYGYRVDTVAVAEVAPGFVGVRRRLLGKEGGSRFAESADEKGILHGVLQPGTYYFNPREYEIIPYEVGVYQKTYHYEKDPAKNTAITFQARDGNVISLDCTVEWEVAPKHMPQLVADYGKKEDVERNVLDQWARKICIDRGFNYGAEDFLEGAHREQFQKDFTEELKRVCEERDVVVRSAFIRNIVIPETFLKQKRDRQLALEGEKTGREKAKTAESANEVADAQAAIPQAEAKVKAETAKKVAEVERERDNALLQADAEIKGLQARYAADIALLDAESRRVTGEARARAVELKETAKGSIHKMKLDAFQNDGDAYLRATLAEKLNPDVTLRLFQSGPGTLWTNLDNKNMSLMLPAPGGAPKPADGKAADK